MLVCNYNLVLQADLKFRAPEQPLRWQQHVSNCPDMLPQHGLHIQHNVDPGRIQRSNITATAITHNEIRQHPAETELQWHKLLLQRSYRG